MSTSNASDQFLATLPERRETPRDGHGRYQIPDSAGNLRSWTRATTLAGAIEERWNLNQWEKRAVAFGIAQRPDLYNLARSAADLDDRETLRDVVSGALDAAGTKVGAHNGTALHNVRARWDRGEFHALAMAETDPTRQEVLKGEDPATGALRYVPSDFVDDIAAYARALDEAGVDVLPEYIEVVIRNEALGCVGTADGLGRVRSTGALVWLDLKSERDPAHYGTVYKGIQLAAYRNGDAIYDVASGTFRPMPEGVDPLTALVIHVRPGSGQGSVWRVDIARGYAHALLAVQVLAARKAEHLVTPYFDPQAKAKAAGAAPEFAAIEAPPLPTTCTPSVCPPEASDAVGVEGSAVEAGWNDLVAVDAASVDHFDSEPEPPAGRSASEDTEPFDVDGFVAEVTSRPKPDKALLQTVLRKLKPSEDARGTRKTLASRIASLALALDKVPYVTESRDLGFTMRDGDSTESHAVKSPPTDAVFGADPAVHPIAEAVVSDRAAITSLVDGPTWPAILTTTHKMIDAVSHPTALHKLRRDFEGRHGASSWPAELDEHARRKLAEITTQPVPVPAATVDVPSLIENARAAIARTTDLAGLTAVWSKWTEVTGFDWTTDARCAVLVAESNARRDALIAANPVPTSDPFAL